MNPDEEYARQLRERYVASVPDPDVDTSVVVPRARGRRRRSLGSGGVGLLVASGLVWAGFPGMLAWSSANNQVAAATNDAWQRPAWFAEHTLLRETYRDQLQSCLNDRGWEVTVDLNIGVVEPFTREELERFKPDKQACVEELGIPDSPTTWTADSLRERYTMDLDTWQCLRQQGFELEQPPTEEAYVEQMLAVYRGEGAGPAATWYPYEEWQLRSLTGPELEEMELTCPLPGWW